MLYHHGMIALGLGRHEKATKSLEQALASNPYFHPYHAEQARMALMPLLATRWESQMPSKAIS